MAKKIFEVEISNRGPRGYETAALLKMPATWGEFNDALQKARIEDGRCCQNELTRIEYPGIQREMIGDNVDLYELNLLAQRLSELSKDDQMGMDGLLQIEKIHSTGPISSAPPDQPDFQRGYLPSGAPSLQYPGAWGAFV